MTPKPLDYDGAGPKVAPRVSRSEALNLDKKNVSSAPQNSNTPEEGGTQPPDIPRDHIIDPKEKYAELKTVLGAGGRGEDELPPDEMYNLDLLFISQQYNEDQTRRPPRICANALCEIGTPDSLTFLERDIADYPQAKPGDTYIPQPFTVVSLDIDKLDETTFDNKVLQKNLVTISAKLTTETPLSQQLKDLTTYLNEHDIIVAIGPFILDQHYTDNVTPQQERLQAFAALAVQFNIPLMISQSGAEESLAHSIAQFPDELILIYAGTVAAATGELVQMLRARNAYWILSTDFTQPTTTAYQQAILQYPQENILLASGYAAHPIYPEIGWNRIYYTPKVFRAFADALGIKSKSVRHQLLHKLNHNFIRAYFG